MMMTVTLLLSLLAAPTFSITAHRDGRHITLRYPADVGEWKEVCVFQMGDERNQNDPEGREGFSTLSCWKPARRIEQLKLREGVFSIKAWLWTTQAGKVTRWEQPLLNVRVRD